MGLVRIEMECSELHEYVLDIDSPKADPKSPPEEWPFDPGMGKCPKCGATDDIDSCAVAGWAGTYVNRTAPKGEWLRMTQTRGRRPF